MTVMDRHKENKLINLIAQGKTQADAAEKIGVAHITAHRWANREDIKRRIDEQAARLIESLPAAVDLSRKVIDLGKREVEKIEAYSAKNAPICCGKPMTWAAKERAFNCKCGKAELVEYGDKDLIDMGLKEGNRIQQSVGIAPSHTPSVIINAIYNDNSQNVVLPQVQGLLDRLDTIDVSNPPDGAISDSDVLQSDSE
jgi:hypothetical protein